METRPDMNAVDPGFEASPRDPMGRAVRQLQEDCLVMPEGAALGSEEELLARLQVSRPTLRQATRLLEYQGLMTVRRGPGGGYFARRPDVRAVAEAAALFLRSRRTPLHEIVALAHSFSIEASARAARSERSEVRAQLAQLADELRLQSPAAIPASLFVEQEAALNGLIYQMVGSATLELMSGMFTRFGMGRGGNVFEGYPERQELWRPLRLALVVAIVAGDAAKAQELSGRLNRLSSVWVLPIQSNAELE